MPMNQPTEMAGTITDLEQLLQSGVFPDMQPLVDKYQRGSQRETSDLLQAFEQSKRDPRNIVDKIAPFVDLIGYLADRTSGSRQRREEAPGVLRGVRGRRQARLSAKEEKARQAFADKLDLFGVTEGMHTRGLEAGLRIGGGKAADVRSGLGTVTSARGRAATQRAVTAAGERQTAEDKRQARIDSLITRGNTHMDAGGEFHDLPHAVQSAMRGQSGWVEPPDPDQILFETDKFRDEAFQGAFDMVMDAGGRAKLEAAQDNDEWMMIFTSLTGMADEIMRTRYPKPPKPKGVIRPGVGEGIEGPPSPMEPLSPWEINALFEERGRKEEERAAALEQVMRTIQSELQRQPMQLIAPPAGTSRSMRYER